MSKASDDNAPDRTDRAGRRRVLGRWNTLNFRFFGPPHVGRYDGAYPEVDLDPVCPSCGRVESVHESFRTRDGKTLRRCPA